MIKKHSNSSDKLLELDGLYPSLRIKSNVGDAIKNRGLTLREVSNMTGITIARLSELSHLKRTTINLAYITALAKALRISDITELFEIVIDENERDSFTCEGNYFMEMGRLPNENDLELYKK